MTALTDAGVNDGLKRALVGHDIDTRESSHDDSIHARFLTLANMREAINKLAYEGVDFAGLRGLWRRCSNELRKCGSAKGPEDIRNNK